MPDISLCTNIFCPLRSTCYRATAEPSMYQSYASFTYDEETKKCDYYWEDNHVKMSSKNARKKLTPQELADMLSAKLITKP